MSNIKFHILLMLACAGMSMTAVGDDKVYTGLFSNTAVGGYDPVSFFSGGGPVKGKSKIRYSYQDVEWLFASEENRGLFEANPDNYAPQYGGFCAWAVAEKNARAPGNPKYWRIVDGKLYLNYDKTVQEQWLKDIPGHIGRANRNWPKLLDE